MNSAKFEGNGDSVVDIVKPDVVAILFLKHFGRGNFIVEAIDGTGKATQLLVNAIGRYDGSVVLDLNGGANTERLSIKASGPWAILLGGTEFASTMRVPGSMEHVGDAVYTLSADPDTMTFTHEGQGNFIVMAHGPTKSDLLINDIGRYSGTVLVAPNTVLLEVKADGRWTVNVTGK